VSFRRNFESRFNHFSLKAKIVLHLIVTVICYCGSFRRAATIDHQRNPAEQGSYVESRYLIGFSSAGFGKIHWDFPQIEHGQGR